MVADEIGGSDIVVTDVVASFILLVDVGVADTFVGTVDVGIAVVSTITEVIIEVLELQLW